jgi:hypothetical protein
VMYRWISLCFMEFGASGAAAESTKLWVGLHF